MKSLNKYVPLFTALLMAIVVIQYTGIFDFSTIFKVPTTGEAPSAPSAPTAPVTKIEVKTGDYQGQSKVDILTKDKYAPNTDIDVCGIVFLNGDRITDVATTGTADVTTDVGKTLAGFLGQDDTTNGDYNCGVSTGQNGTADWYFEKLVYTASGEAPTAPTMYLCKESSAPTVTAFDENGNVELTTTGTANQSMASGSTYVLPIKIKAVADMCYGQPINKALTGLDYSVVACIKWNSTVFDEFQLRKYETSDEYSDYSDIPNDFTILGDQSRQCWALTDKEVKDANVNWFDLYVDTDDTTAPGDGFLNITIYDVSMYIDKDILGMAGVKFALEDEDNNKVGIIADVSVKAYYN